MTHPSQPSLRGPKIKAFYWGIFINEMAKSIAQYFDGVVGSSNEAIFVQKIKHDIELGMLMELDKLSQNELKQSLNKTLDGANKKRFDHLVSESFWGNQQMSEPNTMQNTEEFRDFAGFFIETMKEKSEKCLYRASFYNEYQKIKKKCEGASNELPDDKEKLLIDCLIEMNQTVLDDIKEAIQKEFKCSAGESDDILNKIKVGRYNYNVKEEIFHELVGSAISSNKFFEPLYNRDMRSLTYERAVTAYRAVLEREQLEEEWGQTAAIYIPEKINSKSEWLNKKWSEWWSKWFNEGKFQIVGKKQNDE